MKLKKTLLICSCVMVLSLSGCMSKEAKAAQEAINALPAEYSVSADDAIAQAQALYDALPEKQKEKVAIDSLNTLKNAQFEYQKKAIETMVDAYSADYDENVFTEIKSFYDSLPEEKKNQINAEPLNIVEKALSINNSIDALNLKYSNFEEAQNSFQQLKDLMPTINEIWDNPELKKCVDFQQFLDDYHALAGAANELSQQYLIYIESFTNTTKAFLSRLNETFDAGKTTSSVVSKYVSDLKAIDTSNIIINTGKSEDALKKICDLGTEYAGLLSSGANRQTLESAHKNFLDAISELPSINTDSLTKLEAFNDELIEFSTDNFLDE